jgi:hypothetical protein
LKKYTGTGFGTAMFTVFEPKQMEMEMDMEI